MNKYTNERNIQMLIYMLKENNINQIIVNPGTMNMSFVASLQSDSFFKLYSCVDERSACYMACGLAAESGEPVVLTCTGATASRNYMPGLTEAYYRKLPIITVTCTPHLGNIGHNIPQMIDRRIELNDTYVFSTYIPSIKSTDDEWNNNVNLNKAFLTLKSSSCGPVHINLGTEVTKVFDVEKLPKFRIIKRYNYLDELPRIDPNKKIAIFIGNHEVINSDLEEKIDSFCEKYNAVVLCDHTSNYFGKYKILFNILCDQEQYDSKNTSFDILIHIGNISGAYMKINVKTVWRVNADGKVVDTFKKLENVFEMNENYFFEKYNSFVSKQLCVSNYETINREIIDIYKRYNEQTIPYSNIYVSKKIMDNLKPNSKVYLGILNSLRSWNYFINDNNIQVFCNTGGFGIDGTLSSLIGASLVNTNKPYFCVLGDLAFFYDMNSLGCREIMNNLRILLINNGCGTEFHNYSHPASVISQDNISKYIAADGHYGNKSSQLVKNYVEALGFEYICARDKDEFNNNVEHFCSDELFEKPIVFEIFTDSDEESKALLTVRNLKKTIKGNIKNTAKRIMSSKIKKTVKNILKKD